MGQALADRYAERGAPLHVEQRIHGGFYSAVDNQLLENFKTADWRDRARLVDQLDALRLKQLGKRLIFLNAQKFSSEEYRSAARTAIRDRWLTNEPTAPWTTNYTR